MHPYMHRPVQCQNLSSALLDVFFGDVLNLLAPITKNDADKQDY